MSARLLFQDMVFHRGLNLTCRKGLKWAFLKPYDRIDIGHSLNKPILGEALVHVIYKGPFWLLPDEMIKREHYPPARERKELLREMGVIYGELEAGDIVTAIIFEPLWEVENDY